MSDVTIIGIKTCETCRKALKKIDSARFHDIREHPLKKVDIDRYLAIFGDALVNRRSTTWRGLSETDRARPARDLLAEHSTLMKRPVIEAPGGPYLGWDASVQKAVLGSG